MVNGRWKLTSVHKYYSLSIVIVNFRSSALILDCLQSLHKYNYDLSLEVIVVDNNSGDNSETLITTAFPDIHWIQMTYNAGFARANNEGIRRSRGEMVLLLNPDTLALDDSITQCVKRLQNSNNLAAGVQLLDAALQPQISGSRFVWGGLNHLLPLPYWGSLVRWLGYKSGTKAPGVQEARGEEEVDWISGAFLMVKRDAIEKAGLMDEDFFLYAEEVEWCSRLRQFGRLCIYGDLRIIHLEGGSINKEQSAPEKGYYNLYDKKGLQLMVSNHLRVRKQYGIPAFLFLLLNYSWAVICLFVCSLFDNLFKGRNPFGSWSKARLFALNVARLWKLSPTIIAGKPHFYKMF